MPERRRAHPADFQKWAPRLLDRLGTYRPEVACCHGLTAYRALVRYCLSLTEAGLALSPQERRLGSTRLFVVPNPSPANAHFRIEDPVAWYDRLDDYLADVRSNP